MLHQQQLLACLALMIAALACLALMIAALACLALIAALAVTWAQLRLLDRLPDGRYVVLPSVTSSSSGPPRGGHSCSLPAALQAAHWGQAAPCRPSAHPCSTCRTQPSGATAVSTRVVWAT